MAHIQLVLVNFPFFRQQEVVSHTPGCDREWRQLRERTTETMCRSRFGTLVKVFFVVSEAEEEAKSGVCNTVETLSDRWMEEGRRPPSCDQHVTTQAAQEVKHVESRLDRQMKK